MQRNQAAGRRGAERCLWKSLKISGFPVLVRFLRWGDTAALRGRRRLPEERMQPAGSKDGDSAYTGSDREVQNGNSGSDNAENYRLDV
jgi:hypothetical protein